MGLISQTHVNAAVQGYAVPSQVAVVGDDWKGLIVLLAAGAVGLPPGRARQWQLRAASRAYAAAFQVTTCFANTGFVRICSTARRPTIRRRVLRWQLIRPLRTQGCFTAVSYEVRSLPETPSVSRDWIIFNRPRALRPSS